MIQPGEGRIYIYKVGDCLVHPGHGGCTVRELCHRTYGGQKALYFVLIPECDPGTKIMIPVESTDQIGLREIISSKEADRILSFLSDAEVEWDNDPKHRKQSYEAAIKSADLYALARMIKELLIQETRTILGNYEKELLPRAKKRLFSEISLAKGLRFDDTVRMACHAIQV